MHYEFGRASRIGNRDSNQDRMAALEGDGGTVLVLADGMGGQSGGALAAQTVVDFVSNEFSRLRFPVPYPQNCLTRMLHKAHQAVLAAGMQQDPPVLPGTTAVVCLVQERKAWWAHVGDSRLYLFRNGLPLYRTRDHSYVEQLYQAGRISLDMRQGHPMRNYVTQCLGLRTDQPQITLSNETTLEAGDVLLLCSDGLWEPLDDAHMGAVLAEGRLGRAIDTLAERAEEAAYPHSDNISALAMRIVSLNAKPGEKRAEAANKRAAAPASDDPLANAIEEIERAVEQYKHEMDD